METEGERPNLEDKENAGKSARSSTLFVGTWVL